MDYNIKKGKIPVTLTVTCIMLAVLIGMFGFFCMNEMKKIDAETSSSRGQPVIHVSK